MHDILARDRPATQSMLSSIDVERVVISALRHDLSVRVTTVSLELDKNLLSINKKHEFIVRVSVMARNRLLRIPQFRLNGFDFFVLAGAAVNLVVIATLVVYWLFAP